MKPAIDRVLRKASSSWNRNISADLNQKQTPDGKGINTENSSQPTNSDAKCENPLYLLEYIETQNSFICGVCDTALHFRRLQFHGEIHCSICNQLCGFVQLVCDSCGLCICCNKKRYSRKEWKPSCYCSYFDPVESLREQLYNQQVFVSEFNAYKQQRWLQCMWHDIVQNMSRFHNELQHVSRMDATNVALVIQNLGMETAQGLVRLFVIYQSKLSTDIVEWYSNIIEKDRETLGRIVLESCASLKARAKQMIWLMHKLRLNASNCQLGSAVGIAAKMGNMEIVEHLMQDVTVDPSMNDNFAIQWASRNGHSDVLERLLQDHRVDPSANDNEAIAAACENGHFQVVKRLLQDSRVDPSAQDNVAIGAASANGHTNIVELLLRDGRVDPSAHGNDALQTACQGGYLNVVKLLLQDSRVDPTAGDNFAMQLAFANGHLSVVEVLLQDDRVDPGAEFTLHWASRYGFVSIVERLIQNDKVDPSIDDNFAIRSASEGGNLDVVERLLDDSRVDPSTGDNHAIQQASWRGHVEVVERLLQDDRVNPAARGNYAFRLASEKGRLSVVHRLLQDDRVDPAAYNNYAIRWASRNGHLDVVERLLQDDRVDPAASKNHALRAASFNGHLSIVERLLQDNRVDPAAEEYGAIKCARDPRMLEYLYNQTRSTVCYLMDDSLLMKVLTRLHNEILVVGGLCLCHLPNTTTLPNDIVILIVSEWSILV